MKARRRSVAEHAQRRRRRQVTAVLVLVLVAAGGTGLAFSPLFAVQDVHVDGVEGPRADHVRRTMHIVEGTSILTADLGQAEDRVASIPWVADAQIGRDLPTTLQVDVAARAPVLLVEDGGAHWQLDAEGVVVADGAVEGLPVVESATAILPPEGEVVRDAALRNVLAVHSGLDATLAEQIARYEAAGPRGARAWYVLPGSDDTGVWIRFGDADRIERKSAVTELLLEQIDSQHEATGGAGLADVAEVDVRAPENPVVVPVSE